MNRRNILRDSRPVRRSAGQSASLGPMDAEHKPVTIAEVIAGG
jgi:hypothetical protein